MGIAKPLNITAINAGLAAWNLCLAQYAASKVEVWGRRPLFFASIIGMFCSYVVVMALSATFAEKGNQAAGIAVVPFLFFFYGGLSCRTASVPSAYIQDSTISPGRRCLTTTRRRFSLMQCEPRVLRSLPRPKTSATHSTSCKLLFTAMFILTLVHIFVGFPWSRKQC